MRQRVLLAVLAMAVTLLPSISHAGPIFAGFPAPGGTTFSASGPSLIDSPGRTRSYSGFDPSQWSELYFNITGGNLDGVTFDTRYDSDGGFGVPTYSFGGNNNTWFMSGTWTFFNPACPCPVSTTVKLVTNFFMADGITPIFGNLFSSTPGDGLPKLVLKFDATDLASWGGGFKVTQIYQTTGGIDAADWFNSHNGGGGLTSSTNAAFWYDAPISAEVPEPGSLVLLGTGILAFARRLRRPKSGEQA